MFSSSQTARSKAVKSDDRRTQTITLPTNAFSDGSQTRWTHLSPGKKCNRNDDYWLMHIGDAVAKAISELQSSSGDGETLGLDRSFSYDPSNVKYVLDRLPDGYAGFKLTTGKQEHVIDGHPRGKSARRIGEVREHMVRLVLGRDLQECKCSLCHGWKAKPTKQPTPKDPGITQDVKAGSQQEQKMEQNEEAEQGGEQVDSEDHHSGSIVSRRSLNTGFRANLSLQVDQNGRASIAEYEGAPENTSSPTLRTVMKMGNVPTVDAMDIDEDSKFPKTEGRARSNQPLLQSPTIPPSSNQYQQTFRALPSHIVPDAQQSNAVPQTHDTNGIATSRPVLNDNIAALTDPNTGYDLADSSATVQLPYMAQHSLQNYAQNATAVDPARLIRNSFFPNIAFSPASGGQPSITPGQTVSNYMQSLSTSRQVADLHTASPNEGSPTWPVLPWINNNDTSQAASHRLARALSHRAVNDNGNLTSITPDLITEVENHISIADVIAFADANGFRGPVDFIRAIMVDMHRPGGVRGLDRDGN